MGGDDEVVDVEHMPVIGAAGADGKAGGGGWREGEEDVCADGVGVGGGEGYEGGGGGGVDEVAEVEVGVGAVPGGVGVGVEVEGDDEVTECLSDGQGRKEKERGVGGVHGELHVAVEDGGVLVGPAVLEGPSVGVWTGGVECFAVGCLHDGVDDEEWEVAEALGVAVGDGAESELVVAVGGKVREEGWGGCEGGGVASGVLKDDAGGAAYGRVGDDGAAGGGRS